jgi:GPCR proteolysis site, GPS, motif
MGLLSKALQVKLQFFLKLVNGLEATNFEVVLEENLNLQSNIKGDIDVCFTDSGLRSVILPDENILGFEERLSLIEIPNSQTIFTLFTYMWPENSSKYDNDKEYLSDVMSVFVKQTSDINSSKISGLEKPIKFCHLYENSKDEIFCGYSEEGSEWKTEGCRLIASDTFNSSHSVALCQCNHLTDFGIFSGLADITSSSNFDYLWEGKMQSQFNIPGNTVVS